MSTHRLHRHAPDELELIAYADGRLDAGSARGREIEAWLKSHPAADARVRAYVRQDQDIREHYAPLLAEPLPPQLRPNVIRHRQGGGRSRPPQVAVAAVVAATLVVALALAWLLYPNAETPEAQRHAGPDEAVIAPQPDQSVVAPQIDQSVIAPQPDQAVMLPETDGVLANPEPEVTSSTVGGGHIEDIGASGESVAEEDQPLL